MGYGSLWEGMLVFFSPLAPTLKGMEPLNPLISIVILGLIASVLIRGHRRYELLRMETEALVRRYMIFRGKRHGTLSKVRAAKGTRENILKSISRSWYTFKEYHVQKRRLLARNYRGMKQGFIIGCVLLVLNTVREGVSGLLITKLPSGLFTGLAQSLPQYLIIVVGIALQCPNSTPWARGGGPLCRFRPGRPPPFRGVRAFGRGGLGTYSSSGLTFSRHLFISPRCRLVASIFSLYERGMEVGIRGLRFFFRARNFISRRRKANSLFLA